MRLGGRVWKTLSHLWNDHSVLVREPRASARVVAGTARRLHPGSAHRGGILERLAHRFDGIAAW